MESIDEIRHRAQFAYALYEMSLTGDAPVTAALRSRIGTPLLGSTVLEVTTAHYKLLDGGKDASGFGRLTDRLWNSDWEVDPMQQRYYDYLYRIEPLDGGEPVNWTNASFITVFDWAGLKYFQRCGWGESLLHPQCNYSPLDKATWWWLKSAATDERQIMARTAKECATV